MFKFVTQTKFDAALKEKDRVIAVERENKRRMAESLEGENRNVRRQLAEALSELHSLKAKRARANANLIPGGPKAKARVMAARAQQKELG